jgi:FkbM family methyltransferase
MPTQIDHPHQWYGGRSYAQHGDDFAILNIFHRLKIKAPSYLDVGAHHPFDLSNTALLYARGSRGINVEANPSLIEAFKESRPQDMNLCAAVGPVKGVGQLSRFSETSGINTILPVFKADVILHDIITVPITTVDSIIDNCADGVWPDFFNLDAEGMDIEILKSINFKDRDGPKVICAEAVSQQTGDVENELRSIMLPRGYKVHSWAGNNMLFIRYDLEDLCR